MKMIPAITSAMRRARSLESMVPPLRLDYRLRRCRGDIRDVPATLAVSLYGITRDQDRDLAFLAFTCRVMEAVFGAIAPPAALGLLWLATEGAAEGPATNLLGSLLLRTRAWSIQTSATLFAAGSTLFSWLLLRGRMIPAPLAWLGVVASVLLLFALPLQLTGLI